ncbi:hypothetical protein ACH5RR_037908 [Cinchona calisaya]|uniref:Uncharacterized protein n=1 Tax=Cinchona calisaya TaxID=153742 RepID=A0ABD2Y7I9_9GENT
MMMLLPEVGVKHFLNSRIRRSNEKRTRESRSQSLGLIREGLQSTACKETELDPSNESPSSLPETQTWTSPDHMDTESETCNFNATEVVKLESVEMNGSYVLGLFEPVAGCPKFKAGSDFFLPILDNNGFLLGEFSKLDDLSICHNEDDNVPTKFSV